MNRDVINDHYHGDPADPATERARERIHWICSQATGKDILDVGCSQGIVCLILGREGFQCTGVDIEAGSLAAGQQALSQEDETVRQRVNFQVADAAQLPFSDKSFDMVVLGEILEHLVHPARVLAETKRVLRDGGRLVVTVPYGLNAFPDHKRTFYPVSLLQLLQPYFKTTFIGTRGDYITYTGSKDATYDPAQISRQDLFDQYLSLETSLEARCLAKERALLEKATELYAQIRKLTAQSAAHASRITELEKTLGLRDEQLQKLEKNLEQARAAMMEFRTEAVRAQTESLAQAVRLREVQETLATREDRLRDFEATIEQQRAFTTELSESLFKAETESAVQTNRAKDLQDILAAKEEQLANLQSAVEKQRSSLTGLGERVGRAEAESAAQANKAKELQDALTARDGRIRELETILEQARASIADFREGKTRAESESASQAGKIRDLERATATKDDHARELEKTLRQERETSIALRKEIAEAESARARLNTEATASKSAAKTLESKLATLEAEKKQLTAENKQLKDVLSAKNAAAQQQAARTEQASAALQYQPEKQESALAGVSEDERKRRLSNQRIRDLVRLVLPPGAQILVISKGDDDLMNLDGRIGMHFPQTETGVYAGYHPADSAEAIKHLEALKATGAEFLLVPAGSFWWLEFYQDFRQHLDSKYEPIAYNEHCLIFALRSSPSRRTRFRLSVQALPKDVPKPAGSDGPSSVAGASAAGAQTHKSLLITAGRRQTDGQGLGAVPAGSKGQIEPKSLSVACVLDEFTEACFYPEWKATTFRPDNWETTLESTAIDLLFVESAWKGNQGSWQYKVASVAKGHELEEVASYCRAKGIPTAFWNKEDPVHFDRFIKSASFFDYVFTTDADCIPRYKEHLQHDKIFALPFAAQAKLHNPILQTERLHNVCFAGAYYGLSHDERRKDMDIILKPGLGFGLHIFDRQHGLVGTGAEQYRYPDVYQPAIKGYLPYEQLVKAYKRYRVFLNVNSVKTSPTMFSRRVFELLASGTPVISSYARGIENLLGTDLVLFSESEQQTKKHLERLLADEQEWARLSTRGIRTVFDEHTYRHRCDQLFNQVNPAFPRPTLPKITVITKAATLADLEHVAATLKAQTYRHLSLAFFPLKNLKESQVRAQMNSVKDIPVQVFPSSANMLEVCMGLNTGEYLWFLNLSDYYGPDFLKDCVLATTYSNTEFIGKHTHYMLAKNLASIELSSPGYEFRLVDSIAPGSLLAKCGSLSSKQWEAWLSQRTVSLGKERALSIDRFNYIRNAFSAQKSHSDHNEHLFKGVTV